jgi:hypothetical protein
MNCPDCGAENLEGAAYCEDCGSKLAPGAAPAAGSAAPAPQAPPEEAVAHVMTASGMIKCGACGAENPATEAYCEDCGAGLGGAPATPVGEPVAPVAATPPAANCAKLILVTGGKEFPLNKDVMTIGRRSPADGVYPDVDLTDHDPESYVSRRHAQVIHQGGQFIFEDVGSANGSFVNNVRATKGNQSVLKDNDQVRLGKTEMLFKAAE